MIYVDTSALVAYYCPEPISDRVEAALLGNPRPTISNLVELELFSAVARKVRTRSLSPRAAERICSMFERHLDGQLYTRAALTTAHFRKARGWLLRWDLPLRTLDALHLAMAVAMDLCLLTADAQLARSAEALGAEVELLVP